MKASSDPSYAAMPPARKRRSSDGVRASLVILALVAAVSIDSTPYGEARAAGVCAQAPDHLSTAAGIDPLPAVGGIGGTGRSGEDNEGGIGGTGIVGTITGFASVCVNGVEVHYDDKVPVSENGQTSSVSALAVGQVVALEAAPGVRGLTARKIEVIHALEGPVTRRDGGRLEVMGAGVIAAEEVMRGAMTALQPGDWVRVAGHRDGSGQWVATRVAKIAARNEVTVQGGVDAGDRIAGVRIEHAAGSVAAVGEDRLVRGEWIESSGDAGGGRIRVRAIAAAASVGVLAGADRIIVETRVREIKDGRVRGGDPSLDNLLSGRDLREGQLVRVRAHRSADGRFVVDRVERSRDTRPEAGGRRDGRGKEDGDDRSGSRNGASGSGRDRAEGEQRGGRGERTERSERVERGERGERHERRERD